jgi:hypothetical protein
MRRGVRAHRAFSRPASPSVADQAGSENPMPDLLMAALIVGAFALLALYVAACGRA